MTAPQPRPEWDDSIDLRKWVDALIRYKFLIVGIVVAAVGVAAVFSYLVQTPRFESTAGAVLPPANGEGGLGLSLRGYRELATSTAVIERMRQNLGLASAPALIRNQLEASTDEKERYISVTASAETSEEAFSLASQWIESYGEKVRDDIQIQFSAQKEDATQKVNALLPEFTAAQDALASFDLDNPLGVREGQLSAMEQELASNETRLRLLLASDTGEDPAVRAYLQAILSDTAGTLGGGGTPGVSGLPGVGADSASESNSATLAESIFDELSRGLEEARLSTLEKELVQSESRLRLLTGTTIPVEEARLISLEKFLQAEPQTFETEMLSPDDGSPIGITTLNPVYLKLRQRVADTSIGLDSLKKEASELSARISFLYTESDLLRRKLAAGEAADISKEEAGNLKRTLALASNITFLRQETDAIRRQLAVDKQARQDLEQEVQELKALYQPAQDELDRLQEIEPRLATISSLSAIREPALPTSPVSPQRTRNIMLAGALGLMLGVFAALFLEFYRSTTPSVPAREG